MSIITKILVVLVALAAVVLTPLLVVYVNNATHIRQQYETQQSQRVAAQNAAEAIQNRYSNLQAQFADLQKSLNDREKELQAKVNEAKAEAQQFKAEAISERTRNQGLEQNLAEIRTQLQEQNKLIAMYTKELDERRGKNLNLRTTLVEVSRKLAEEQTQSDTLLSQVRLLREQMKDLEEQYTALNEKYVVLRRSTEAAGAGDEVTVTPSPITEIRGQVIEVETAGGQTFVALNVGENDNVREGMEFIVHDGGTFLGNAKVSTVDKNTSAAVLTLKKGEVAVGASVMAGVR